MNAIGRCTLGALTIYLAAGPRVVSGQAIEMQRTSVSAPVQDRASHPFATYAVDDGHSMRTTSREISFAPGEHTAKRPSFWRHVGFGAATGAVVGLVVGLIADRNECGNGCMASATFVTVPLGAVAGGLVGAIVHSAR